MQVWPKSSTQKNLVVVSRLEKDVHILDFIFGYIILIETSARTSTHLGHPLMCFICKLWNFGTDVLLAPISMFTFWDCIFASWKDSRAMLFHTLVERSCSVSSNQNHGFSQLAFVYSPYVFYITFDDSVFQRPSFTLLALSSCLHNGRQHWRLSLRTTWAGFGVVLIRECDKIKGSPCSHSSGICSCLYVDRSISLCEVKLVRVHKTAFMVFFYDFPISEVRLEA